MTKLIKHKTFVYALTLIVGFSFFMISPVKAGEDISHYTCAMHPSVKVNPKNYDNGDTKCPICNMDLMPVMTQSKPSMSSDNKNVISRVSIKDQELQRAGIQTERVIKRHLFKEIRTVGTVAYDPKLAIAQDEYLSASKAFEKAKTGKLIEITQRAEDLVQSAENKLRLLGLSEKHIDELKRESQIQTNLVLPEKKMWIYGDAYEYELPWITEGAKVKVTLISLPGKEFYGHISSINPVIDSMTRTLRFRALVDNPNLKLKPQMYVNILVSSHYVNADEEHDVLAIPKNALLDTGLRRIVWVETSLGQFEGKKVEVGPLASVSGEKGQFYPVLSGLKEGDSVVTSGNFLIDSQSQITGSAASSYGGSLAPSENKGSMKGSYSSK